MAKSKEEPKTVVFSEPQKEISHFVIFGDSLSDGKNMGEKVSFLGPLARKLWLKITTLDQSPKERFTNGYTWADSLKSTLISKFLNDDRIKKDRFGKYNLDNADIGDDILFQPPYRRQRYTKEEVDAETKEVERKKRVKDRDEGHLFTAERENNPKTDPILRRYKTNALRAAPIKKMELPKATPEESTDVADQLITDPRYSKYVEEYYSLDNGRVAQYNGQNFYRNYSQGGATSYDYSWKDKFLSLLSPFTSIKLFFTRLMVSNLSKQINQFLKDNEDEEISKDQKKKTLITVFSGANDLITVNPELTKEAAALAAQSNIDNIEKLITKGYRNFVLCNLPDLSLTPRFQGTPKENQAREITEHFNDQLRIKYEALKGKYRKCSIELFDTNKVFSKIYKDVHDNGKNSKYSQYFDQSTLKEPYLDYAKKHNIPITPGGVAPGNKHMFWDDVHPTATMHALLMSEFYKSKQGLGKYKISAPEEQSEKHLCDIFDRKYHEKLKEYSLGALSYYNELSIPYKEPEKALITILRFALQDQNEDSDCLREAMTDLGWWVNGKPNMCIPALADAMWIENPAYARKLEAELDPHLAEPNSHKKMLALGGPSVGQEPAPKRVPPKLDPEVEARLEKILQKKPSIGEAATLQPTTNSKQEHLTPETTIPLTI
ncbi:lipolytic enzyme, GDSL family [Legionella steigerwaltii]|uniref:Lipolytic enzyme, GDSL family n=1 Tax=Legionella steigerwaltii TaxID=460 RepID=A0A378L9Q2_9GAMM|nr:SGNH/GDSL hydrolase family protein [Legionella steigerwaltii]KTD80878.1 lipolytic enzyme, GDSL family [Legionella steigerwaltii]STY23434.1 lipolytic enzyme, GDSL family [Legionella steigerwaltii]